MKRSMFQVYVRGSNGAVPFYQKAFDAPLLDSYLNSDGTYYHSELDVYGQILAVSEAMPGTAAETGSVMQFCLHFEERDEALVRKIYDALKEGAQVHFPLGPCDYSPLMADLTDRFGVRWCLFAC
ncbi:VOC family protein [Pseudoflavonifractor phocaeensis]|uniref:VOC family protein n=1 Tax=Pseudoflavonifractor phocaeensis TaxID=1870988 RepID=UPI00313C8709